MRRNRIRRFFQQKQYAIASIILFIAIAGMTGVYISGKLTNESRQMELAKEHTDKLQQQTKKLQENVEKELASDDPVTSVTSVIPPKEKEPSTQMSDETKKRSETKETTDTQQTAQDDTPPDTKKTAAKTAELHFSRDAQLAWPLQGDVILNYSMDQTVYFATLDQYKYNPAIIIAGAVNDPVKAACDGKITRIETNEETGMTVTMDIGDGYRAVYGQLKEVLYKEGAFVEAGNAVGYLAEPTKYYSVEGSNLYFRLEKNGEPVDPIGYMQ